MQESESMPVAAGLEQELLRLICSTCNLQDVDLTAVGPDDPLIGPDSPLGIDSLDALEIAVAVQREYGVRMNAEHTTREVMQTLASLAAYVHRNR
jgi:acyl carrier protein